MVNRKSSDNHFENFGASSHLQSLLEKYEQWTDCDNFSSSEKRDLRESICNPNEKLWLHACRRAFESNNTEWLKFYERYDGGDERRFPLSTLQGNEFGKKRTHAAVCLTNCALAAASLKTATLSDAHHAVTQFVAYFENALIHWQKSGNPNGTVPFKSQTPPSLTSVEYFLVEIKRIYASANEEFEASPVEALIRYFLGIDTYRIQAGPSGTALFPMIKAGGTVIALLEVDRYDHGTGRLYRDAINSAFIVADSEFYESLQTAFEYIKAQNGDVENYDFYWRVRNWTKNNSGSLFDAWLQKKSVGLAATIAFNDSIRNSDLGAGYLFTGKINNDGTIGVVGDLVDKVNIAESNDFPIFIPKVPEQNSEATKIVSKSQKVRLASSFVDVTQVIQSERQALKDDEDRRLWKQRKTRLAIAAVIVTALFAAVLYAKNYSIEKRRRQVAEYSKQVAEDETEKLTALTNALDKNNAELNITNTLLDKANGELDLKNKKLIDTNADLEVAKKKAVANEQEAQKQRQIAQASKQAAIASQFASEAYKRLAHGDKSGAQSYFAKALTFDDQEDYRAGLVSAYFDAGNNSYKLAWTSDLDGQSARCCLRTAMSHSGVFLATTSVNGKGVRIIRTDEGREVSRRVSTILRHRPIGI
jgi:hypothetical protein